MLSARVAAKSSSWRRPRRVTSASRLRTSSPRHLVRQLGLVVAVPVAPSCCSSCGCFWSRGRPACRLRAWATCGGGCPQTLLLLCRCLGCYGREVLLEQFEDFLLPRRRHAWSCGREFELSLCSMHGNMQRTSVCVSAPFCAPVGWNPQALQTSVLEPMVQFQLIHDIFVHRPLCGV